LFGNDPVQLGLQRDALARWLWEHRGLTLKVPDEPPHDNRAPVLDLGYRTSRTEFALGPTARGRLPRRIRAALDDPDRLRASIASYAAAAMFGHGGLRRPNKQGSKDD